MNAGAPATIIPGKQRFLGRLRGGRPGHGISRLEGDMTHDREPICGFLAPSDDLQKRYSGSDYWDIRWSAVNAVQYMVGARKPIPILEAMLTEPGAKPWVGVKVPRALESLRKGLELDE